MSVLFSEKEVFLEMTLCLSTARLQSYIAYSELTSYAVLFQKNFNSIFVSLGGGGDLYLTTFVEHPLEYRP